MLVTRLSDTGYWILDTGYWMLVEDSVFGGYKIESFENPVSLRGVGGAGSGAGGQEPAIRIILFSA